MLKSIAENRWLRHVAVFVAYALVYAFLQPRSNANWMLTCGLRLSCLLLLPYRYWPTLVLAELGPLAYRNYLCVDQLGLSWAILNSFPAILYVVPAVWWCRQRLSLFPSKRLIRVNALLTCIILVSAIWTAAFFLVIAMMTEPANVAVPYHFHALQIAQIFLGRYSGIIAILPIVLAIRLRKPAPLMGYLTQCAKSRVTLDFAVLLLPALAVLVWINHHASQDARPIIRMAMFLPVAWLTTKHGWRAAAFGITAVMACIYPELQARPDTLDIAGAQAFIAFSSTCLLALGVHITAQNSIEEQERIDAKAALSLAQQGIYLCEVRMRQTAQALEQMGRVLQLTQSRLLNRFRHMLSLTESQSYYKEAASTQSQMYRLVESMHPTAWRERGLPAALKETIARTLDEAGVDYRFELKGRGLSQLSPSVHAAIYRLACETVVYICEQQAWATIAISLRGGLTNGQRWAVLRVEGLSGEIVSKASLCKKPENHQLAAKLGTNGLGISAMRDHVRLYDGELHIRMPQDKFQITALLHDSKRVVRELQTASPALPLYIS